jgi:peptide/nickel transport system substrate-binding protein
MRRTGLQWVAISVLLIAASTAVADTRPQYGGTLRISISTSTSSLDPTDLSYSAATRNLIALIFDTLVTVDASGRSQSALAEAWQSTPGDRGLEFRLRRNVKFHEGTPLTAEIVASSLRKANPSWNVTATGDQVTIESSLPAAELLQEVALPRNAIAKRDSTGSISGTGPFYIVDWQPAKRLVAGANEDYWNGRSFLDEVDVDMARSVRDQMNSLESGKADLVEVAPEQMHRIVSQRYELLRSSPIELIALKFAKDATSAQEKAARDTLRLSIERQSMHNVLLQGAGQPSASLLPTWMSGYGFVFSTEPDRLRAQQLRDQIAGVPSFTLGYNGNDSLARLLAERIALNARDTGLSVQLNASATDLRLVRIPLSSCDPWISLQSLNGELGLPAIEAKTLSVEQLFASEQGMLASGRIIPLFHVPVAYASTTSLHDWAVSPGGMLNVAGAWLKSPQP